MREIKFNYSKSVYIQVAILIGLDLFFLWPAPDASIVITALLFQLCGTYTAYSIGCAKTLNDFEKYVKELEVPCK